MEFLSSVSLGFFSIELVTVVKMLKFSESSMFVLEIIFAKRERGARVIYSTVIEMFALVSLDEHPLISFHSISLEVFLFKQIG